MLPMLPTAMMLTLAGCAAGNARPATIVSPPRQLPAIGLERVMGQDQAGLVRLFGQPDADVREGAARKLQFGSGICVLDTYLYPRGGEGPRVTWLDARQPDGSPIDRASCIAALTRRAEAR